ncbi:MAG: hypothetical protein KAI47_17225 [Deltaproteobacteria bacterium]|nr:hypothetical protein [Deltaproteobacteria bacterium]
MDTQGQALPAVTIPRCPAAHFDPKVTSCGADCPCWRIVRRSPESCKVSKSPFGVDVLVATPPPTGSTLRVRCDTEIPGCGRRLLSVGYR